VVETYNEKSGNKTIKAVSEWKPERKRRSRCKLRKKCADVVGEDLRTLGVTKNGRK